ncbi:MAG: tripartite tricarboxylate transporter TctB family protein [Hyphomicrobiales bacterium]
MRIAAIACVIIGLLVVALAQTISDPSGDAIYGAKFWPVALALALIALNLPAALLARSATAPAEGEAAPSAVRQLAGMDWRAFLLPSVLVATYPLAVTLVGFPLASIVLYVLLMFVLGQRGTFFVPAIGILFPLAMALFFTRVAYMPLPKGTGVFEELTIFLYRLIGAY